MSLSLFFVETDSVCVCVCVKRTRHDKSQHHQQRRGRLSISSSNHRSCCPVNSVQYCSLAVQKSTCGAVYTYEMRVGSASTQAYRGRCFMSPLSFIFVTNGTALIGPIRSQLVSVIDIGNWRRWGLTIMAIDFFVTLAHEIQKNSFLTCNVQDIRIFFTQD